MFKANSVKDNLDKLMFFVLGVSVLGAPFVIDNQIEQSTQYSQLLFLQVSATICASILGLYMILCPLTLFNHIKKTDMLAGLFAFYFIGSSLVANDESLPWAFWGFISLGIFYLAVRVINLKYLRYIFLIIMISATIEAVYGNLQLYGLFRSHHSVFKITGSFFNPGPFAGYLIGVLPISVGVYLFREQLFGKNIRSVLFPVISLISIVAILLILPASGSRAAVIGGIGGAIYLIINKFKLLDSNRILLKHRAFKYIAISAVLVCITFGYALYTLKKPSADGRLLVWKVTSQMISDRPIFGFGFEKFKSNYMLYQASYFEKNLNSAAEVATADNVDYSYNEFLHVFMEFGMLGFLLGMLSLIWFLTSKPIGPDELYWIYIARAGIISLLIFSLFSYPLDIWPIMINAVIYFAVISSYSLPELVKTGEVKVTLKKAFLIPIGVIIIASTILSWTGLEKKRTALHTWRKASVLYGMGAQGASLSEYEKAFHQLNNDGLFLSHYGKALSMSSEHRKAIAVLLSGNKLLPNTTSYTALGDSYKALGQIELAEAAYLKGYHMIPSRFYSRYNLALLYKNSGQPEKALAIAQEILNKPIKLNSAAVETIKREMREIIADYDVQ